MLADDAIASPPARRVDAEPAQRILAAARRLVGERGIDGAHVGAIAEAAGLARGLVRYYFGSKDGLLAEVMEAEARDHLVLLREQLGAATSVDELVAGMAAILADYMREDRGAHLVAQELGGLALRDPAIRARRAQLRARYRREFAAILRSKHDAAAIALGDVDDEGVAAALIALGQGLATEALADPDWDAGPALKEAEAAARHLLGRVPLAR
ncbi:MAG: TetR/AcrR family transcriptional regulator [Solirubrobacteraceae bacterium]